MFTLVEEEIYEFSFKGAKDEEYILESFYPSPQTPNMRLMSARKINRGFVYFSWTMGQNI